jgi:hypothetical protein
MFENSYKLMPASFNRVQKFVKKNSKGFGIATVFEYPLLADYKKDELNRLINDI